MTESSVIPGRESYTQAFISAQGTLVSTSSSGPSSTELTTPYEESINQIVNFLKRDEEDEVVTSHRKIPEPHEELAND